MLGSICDSKKSVAALALRLPRVLLGKSHLECWLGPRQPGGIDAIRLPGALGADLVGPISGPNAKSFAQTLKILSLPGKLSELSVDKLAKTYLSRPCWSIQLAKVEQAQTEPVQVGMERSGGYRSMPRFWAAYSIISKE